MIAFLAGFIWMLGIAFQNRIISRGNNFLILFTVSTVLSLLWGYLIKQVALNGFEVLVPYSFGTGLGTVMGVVVAKKLEK